jgi:arsenite methyltransferase
LNEALFKKVHEKYMLPVRDQVLSRAGLPAGGVLLDIGCGDGLIAFGALEQAPGSQVIFADISAPLLEQSRQIAEQMGFVDCCRFIQTPAENLGEIETGSVDAVTTRAVLIYVKAKQQAFKEFYRVLRPGGWISIIEPINSFGYPPPEGFIFGYDLRRVSGLAQKVRAVYQAIQPLDDPMLDFDERDLIDFAEQAAFSEIHLELRADVQPLPESMPWDTFWMMTPNPKAPTVSEAVQQALTPEETEQFIAVLRPLVESNQSRKRMANAHVWARK